MNLSIPAIVPDGLLAKYLIDSGGGTTLVDSSGNGNDGVFGAGVNAPSWVSGGLQFGGGQFVTLPSALNAAKTIQIFCSYQTNSNTNPYNAPIHGNGNAASSVGLIFSANSAGVGGDAQHAITGGARIWTYGTGAPSTRSRDIFQGAGLVTLVRDTSDRIYIGRLEYDDYMVHAATGNQTTGVYQLGGCAAGLGNAIQTYFTGNVYCALFYDRVLTASEIGENAFVVEALMNSRGISTNLSNAAGIIRQVVADGDSITEGYPNLATPYTASLGLGAGWNVDNQGWPAASIVNELAPTATTAVDPLYHPSAAKNIVVIWAGINDMGLAPIFPEKTPAQTYANLQSYCAFRRAAGWKVVVATMLSATGTGTGGATKDSLKNSYNTLIRAGVGTDYDVLADVAADARLGADGAYADMTYFQPDGIHPTQLSQTTIIAPIISAAIQSL